MTSNSSPARRIPHLNFSHLGICVTDIVKMEDFYTNVLGMTVTDRGNALDTDLVFLSRDPIDHHQIVLGTGRPKVLPENTANKMFGPVINQVSFKLSTLGELKELNQHLTSCYETEYIYANHGTAWSIYFPDPEGNLIETFVDTEWYIRQPVFEPLDLSLSDEEIMKQTLALCEKGQDFMPAKEWREQIAPEMGISSN